MAVVALGVAACTESGAEGGQQITDATVEAEETGAGQQGGLVPDNTLGADAIEVRTEGADVRFDSDCLIAEDSVAGIAIPDTLGDFVSAFPTGTVLSFYPIYMVDFGKLCLRSDGEDALCADFENYNVEIYHPDIDVVGLSVYTPQCRTAGDVGPGSSVGKMMVAYGAPTFGFDYDNESREYVRFADQPERMAFRARSERAEADMSSSIGPGGPSAGDYTSIERTDGSYFETTAFYPDGTIWEVFVSAPFEPID